MMNEECRMMHWQDPLHFTLAWKFTALYGLVMTFAADGSAVAAA